MNFSVGVRRKPTYYFRGNCGKDDYKGKSWEIGVKIMIWFTLLFVYHI